MHLFAFKIQVCVCWFTTQCLHSFLKRVVIAGWCIRCHWETPWWKVCWGHTSHWRCCAPDWVSPPDGEILCQKNTAPLQDSGGLDGGGLWLLMGCQQGQRRAQSPSLLESEPGMMVGLGSTHNSLLGYNIHQDNLLFLMKKKSGLVQETSLCQNIYITIIVFLSSCSSACSSTDHKLGILILHHQTLKELLGNVST